jgi:hypothetical protein
MIDKENLSVSLVTTKPIPSLIYSNYEETNGNIHEKDRI